MWCSRVMSPGTLRTCHCTRQFWNRGNSAEFEQTSICSSGICKCTWSVHDSMFKQVFVFAVPFRDSFVRRQVLVYPRTWKSLRLQQHGHNVQRQEEQARQGGELLYMQLTNRNLAQGKKLPDKLSAETSFLNLIYTKVETARIVNNTLAA